MDDTTLLALLITAGSIGVLHTVTGPDHFVPFIAMSKVGNWSLRRTALITLACGIGHVVGSILLGALGITLGLVAVRLTDIEAARGDVAAWMLLGFGLAYLTWGLVQAYRNRPHAHVHAHEDGKLHIHEHQHQDDHLHVHESQKQRGRMTPWVLFAIFVFGPCEPLIPVLMYPAATLSLWGVVAVAVVFGVATLATMLTIVLAAHRGLKGISLPWLERYSHALAGAAILVCGVAVKFLDM